jgi:histidine kinase-like protein
VTRPGPQSEAPVPVSPPHHQGSPIPGDWPLRTFLELGAFAGAVPGARLYTRQSLWEWRLTHFSDSVELVVSELLTNAVAASQAMNRLWPVRLWVMSDTTRVLISVWDANPHPPVRLEPTEETESGRGLLLVESFSEQWGWYVPDTGGKVVWALVAQQTGR